MKELIEELIVINKQRLKHMNASALQTDSEYQEAYYSGLSGISAQ